MSNIKRHKDTELLAQVAKLPSFKGFPKDYWILGVRSTVDAFNEYDDKFYIFKGKKFVMVLTGTTNPGIVGLKNFKSYGAVGAAVIKSDEWYYRVWKRGLHKGKMEAFCQWGPFFYYRDSNKNNKSEEIGEILKGHIGLNFHTCTYESKFSKALKGLVKKFIGGWSTGCQVCNVPEKYYKFMELTKPQTLFTYCLINEF